MHSNCRAAADAIRIEGAAEDTTDVKPSAAKVTVAEPLGDYLPLPISQQYPKRGTHKLGADRPVQTGNGAEQMQDENEEDAGKLFLLLCAL